MALIGCPECAKQISSLAVACPHCGYPIHVAPSGTRLSPTPLLRNCPDCGASGKVPATCSACQGTGLDGHARCVYCNGSGRDAFDYTCDTCDGCGQLTFDAFDQLQRERKEQERRRAEAKKKNAEEAKKSANEAEKQRHERLAQEAVRAEAERIKMLDEERRRRSFTTTLKARSQQGACLVCGEKIRIFQGSFPVKMTDGSFTAAIHERCSVTSNEVMTFLKTYAKMLTNADMTGEQGRTRSR